MRLMVTGSIQPNALTIGMIISPPKPSDICEFRKAEVARSITGKISFEDRNKPAMGIAKIMKYFLTSP